MTVVSAKADLVEAAKRIDAGTKSLDASSPPLSVDTLERCIEQGDIIVIVNTDNVAVAHFDDFISKENPSPAWWVNPLYGSPTFWRTLLKELALEFVARGHGDTPVRWTASGPVAGFTKTLFKIQAKSGYIEFTPNKALRVLK